MCIIPGRYSSAVCLAVLIFHFYRSIYPTHLWAKINDYKITFKEILTTRYFKLFFEEFRGKPMKKFPFIIFYTVDETEKVIIIKAVFHTAQHPDKYPK